MQRLNNLYMPLYILMVINGNGQGQVAALFLLAHETSANISKMLLIFRQRNVISEATKVIFTDKDFSEREAIRQIFPHVNLLLCFFHTLKTFRSKMTKLGLSNEERKKALHILQQIAYSSNEMEYEKYHDELLNLKNPKISEYFNSNWHPIRYEWVRGFIKMEKTFSVTTTNHLESLNNKIKQVVSRNSTLLSFFKDLMTALDSTHGEQKSRAIDMVLKHSTQNEKGSIEEFYDSHLTPYAWNLVCSEIEAAKNMTFCFESTASHDACGCPFFKNTSLPCRHIFWKRNDAGLTLTADALIPLRFTKKNHVALYTTSQVNHPEPPTCIINSLPPPEKARILNKQDKYKKAMEVCGDIANILSDYGTKHFKSALEELLQFKTMLLENKNMSQRQNRTDLVAEGAGLEEEDFVAGGAGLEVQEVGLKDISLKGMCLKRRGRPKGADTTVVGLKRKRK
uniref:Zinc finger SWIM domain-containing protein 3 n=1 Tax=Cacopsylla melanoneura TaxID=428564 RepID=A0A8D8RSP0_9HEMI